MRADVALENAVKATYLYKLPQFVTWPAGSLPPDRFVLCVIGRGRFGGVLDQAVEGQKVQRRPILVRRYLAIGANPGCQLMYIAGSQEQSVANVLAITQGAPVLTVTDGQSATTMGMINFVVIGGRVRFEIDQAAAAASGLAISSKLMSLAVRPGG